MSKTVQKTLTSIDEPKEFMRHASDVISSLQSVINGQLDFSNMKTQLVDVIFTGVSVDQKIKHNLNKTGVNYIVVDKSGANDVVHNSSNQDTANYIVLRATATGFVRLLLF